MTQFVRVLPYPDPPQREATVSWVLEELEKDLREHRHHMISLVYGFGIETETPHGPRVTMWSKTGGVNEVKLATLLSAIHGLRENSKKIGWDWLHWLPWWKRAAFYLILHIP